MTSASRDPGQLGVDSVNLEYLVNKQKKKNKMSKSFKHWLYKKTLYKMKILTCKIKRVSMKLFRELTEGQREFMKKIAVTSQFLTIYNHET